MKLLEKRSLLKLVKKINIEVRRRRRRRKSRDGGREVERKQEESEEERTKRKEGEGILKKNRIKEAFLIFV